jgi:hypothetical protein
VERSKARPTSAFIPPILIGAAGQVPASEKRVRGIGGGEESVEIERSTYITILLAALFLILGTLTAHAQTATPTATPTPGLCSITTLPNGATPFCATGAEPPPSFLGVSGGNYNSVATVKKTGVITCCTGTLGALVEDNNANPYVLSSSHVFARNSSTGKSAAANEPIVQPGLVDLGCWQDPTDTVAKLSNWSKINFSGGANALDAAIAKVVPEEAQPSGTPTPGIDPQGRILNLVDSSFPTDEFPAGQISSTPFPFNSLFDGMYVLKMGRTSCLTSGQIDAFDAMGKVVYPPNVCNVVAAGTALFNHQILVIGAPLNNTAFGACTFAQSGDAGALVVTATGFLNTFECPQAIGIVFAGTPQAGVPYGPETSSTIVAVNPIQTILTKFNVSLVGKACTPSAFDSEIASPMPAISAAHRQSIEQVRTVKNRYAARLLKMDEVTAIGIGSGDDSDHAALNVYLEKDTPTVRAKIPAEIDGVAVHIKHAPKFRAL